jgi:hypothetical protein
MDLFGVHYRVMRCPRCRARRRLTFYAPHRMICSRGHVCEMDGDFRQVLVAHTHDEAWTEWTASWPRGRRRSHARQETP